MLKQILDSAGLNPQTSAGLLGINPRIFNEWIVGQRPIPESMVQRLSTILGVAPGILRATRNLKGQQADITPAIWYKLRGNRLVEADREFVLLIRMLGYYIDQLEQATKRRAVVWKSLFQDIVRQTDTQAPPREQGRQAARMFRESTGLGQGCTGIGEVLRGHLRSRGLLVIESPLPESQVEGCTFFVGTPPSDRPCLFANLHGTTWFRRNVILMHEVCHAIFDASNQGASLDFRDGQSDIELAEERAQAFAQEALVPREVLRHITQTRGILWGGMTQRSLARLVAETHVEQKLVIRAAVENELLSPEDETRCLAMEIADDLRELSDHALSAEEYIQKIGVEEAKWAGKRNTTIPIRSLRLPVPYIDAVLEAFKDGKISRGKAAELLMVDEQAFDERFGEVAEACED